MSSFVESTATITIGILFIAFTLIAFIMNIAFFFIKSSQTLKNRLFWLDYGLIFILIILIIFTFDTFSTLSAHLLGIFVIVSFLCVLIVIRYNWDPENMQNMRLARSLIVVLSLVLIAANTFQFVHQKYVNR